VRLARAALHLLAVVIAVALTFAWLPQDVKARLKARWSRQLLGMLGVRLQADGAAPAGGLLVANHISWLDILALNALAPACLVSKDDVRRWPVIGWLSAQMATLFIERGSRSAAQRTREHLVAELRQGKRVGVFPEGTTGLGDRVLPFHGALFQAAIDARCAVTPLLLHYTEADGQPSEAAAYVGDTTFWASCRAIVGSSGLTVHAAFLAPIEAADSDRRHLAHHSHRLIAHALAAAITPNRSAPPDGHRAVEKSAHPPSALPSGNRPTGNRNRAPEDSSPA
jgi:1-acyl-sn-glycerol-3-phosphate acyltransferase